MSTVAGSGEPLRVLCVFSTLDCGGSESMCMNLYRHMDRSKVQFDFVKHAHGRGFYEDEIEALGGRVFEAPRLRAMNTVRYVRWWQSHFRAHPEHRIVHGHFFSIATVYLRIAKCMGRVAICHVHASAPSGKLRKSFETSARGATDYSFACSSEAGAWFFGKRPYSVLRNAVDVELFAFDQSVRTETRRILGINDELVMGTVANLSAVKNPIGLLDVFAAVYDRQPEAKLLWIGEGQMRDAIEERIQQKGLESQVFLLGRRNDVSRLLQAMDVFVLPSLSEGLPLSLIEAQASGLPCLVSDSISREVDITGLCDFLDFSDLRAWVDAALTKYPQREDTSDAIAAAGYDINSTAVWLQQFYLGIALPDVH